MTLAAAARIATPHAGKYLAALCTRLARRGAASMDGDEGRIDLPLGPCHLSAFPASLALVVEASDETALSHLKWVIANHLQRVAAGDPLEVEWSPVW